MLEPDSLDFSFSGLKTAVLYTIQGQDRSKSAEPPTGQRRADIAASFQQAVVDVLVRKARLALTRTGLSRLAVGGGVSANRALRAALQAMCDAEGVELFIPPPGLCTDNAAMAALAVEKWKRGEFAALDLDAEPSLT
jgi:N6-L-threonylcarbamoyladenine synthase